jgi:glycosyltransferase involved in cell wall biosynthesis
VGNRLLWSPGNSGPLAVSRQVLTVHDLSVFDQPEAFTQAYTRLHQALLMRLSRVVQRIITDSEFTRTRLLEVTGIASERVVVIRLGVNDPSVIANRPDAGRVLERLGVVGGGYFLAVGSLEPRKNIGTLIAAWTLAERRLPEDCTLVIVGEQGSARIFSQRAELTTSPSIRFVGRLPDDELAVLYRNAFAFVFPSLYEGFGLPPLEAAVVGCPSIVSDIPVMHELLDTDALYFDPRSPSELAGRMLTLLEDPALRQRLGDRARQRAALLTWDRAATATRRALNDLLA